MASYEVKSKSTDDFILITILENNIAEVTLKMIEQLNIHLELLSNALKFLKKKQIKKVLLKVSGHYTLPPEGEFKITKDGFVNAIMSDVQHFDSLYRKNLKSMIDDDKVSFPFEKPDKDGWMIAIKNKKKARNEFMSTLEDEIALLGMNWGE